jgi:thiol-disulfide isomerase/thioredoxin
MWLAALLVGSATAGALADELSVGDPAPKLGVKEFVKGEPLTKLEKGKTYVVEFWATWCGPCRVSIPHLTDLQKKYKDVAFVGVSVWERDAKGVKPFVEEMGDKMDYRVAVDDVPESGDANDGAMAKTWMNAAGQNGIPAAFVVNGDGKIAWIGHPMEMDKPLADIVAGKWDLAAASAQFKREQARGRKINELRTKLAKASKSGDSKAVLSVIEAAIADEPDFEGMLALGKYRVLAGKDGDPEKAQEYGKRLVDKIFKDNAAALNQLAWLTVASDDDGKPNAKLVTLAVAAALRADELSKGKDANIADTLARAYFVSGDAAKALECQERAMKLVKGTPQENNKEMQQHLEDYKKAVEKAAAAGK